MGGHRRSDELDQDNGIGCESTGCVISLDSAGRFRFREPLDFHYESIGNEWVVIGNDYVWLHVGGPSLEEAIDDLEETLGDIYEDYVLCDESELHESGLELRRWFIGNVRVQRM